MRLVSDLLWGTPVGIGQLGHLSGSSFGLNGSAHAPWLHLVLMTLDMVNHRLPGTKLAHGSPDLSQHIILRCHG